MLNRHKTDFKMNNSTIIKVAVLVIAIVVCDSCLNRARALSIKIPPPPPPPVPLASR